ncbi:MAG TPA: hypothetical protein VKU01_32495 [Bryobacteraceae bacterium]|nr:hypothetical protein [Bryobacteraceae bacterium]
MSARLEHFPHNDAGAPEPVLTRPHPNDGKTGIADEYVIDDATVLGGPSFSVPDSMFVFGSMFNDDSGPA